MPSFSGKKFRMIKKELREECRFEEIWYPKRKFKILFFVTRWHYMPSFSSKKFRMIEQEVKEV